MKTKRPQRFGVAVDAMAPRSEADHPCSGCEGSGRTNFGIFENDAVANRNVELTGSVEIDVRCRLAALDMLAAAVDMVTECAGESEMAQVRPDPPCRAR